jgi:LmbE family N-acetylglucosaminyl deacetylase
LFRVREFVIAAANRNRPQRILLIVAHPDDETIGAGVLVSRSKDVVVLHVTEGSPPGMSDAVRTGFSSREEYASARVAEARSALALAGVDASAIRNMQFTDQRVSFCLGELTVRVLETLERERPAILLTHAYEGGHPDHDSVAFACHMAHQMYGRKQRSSGPRLLEFAGYHGENGGIKTYEFLRLSGPQEIRRDLSLNQQNLKKQMLKAFKTQAKTLQAFLPARVERYREPPKYDFGRPPHWGKLCYEHFDWGVDGATWRGLAQRALLELQVPARKI